MFQGSSALTLDAKGRITMPTRHRDALAQEANSQLTLTRHPDGCLLVYPRPVWEAKLVQVAALPATSRTLQRLLMGHAQDVDIDTAGRVLVAPALRSAAKLSRDVMLLGMGTHFELWDAEALAACEQADLAKGMADMLDQFSF